MTDARRIVVGITGATGAIYGVRLLERLREVPEIASHLVISDPGKRTIVEQTECTVAEVEALAHRHYDDKDIGAALASARSAPTSWSSPRAASGRRPPWPTFTRIRSSPGRPT